MNPELCIRRGRPEDSSQLTHIARTSKAHWGYSEEDMARWTAELVISPDSILDQSTFVAVIEEEPLGFCQLSRTRTGLELEHFWVLPDSMGRGMGRALLERAAEEARRLGYSRLDIDADPHAEAFYLNCGAVPTGAFIDAPISSDPQRRRPQLELKLNTDKR